MKIETNHDTIGQLLLSNHHVLTSLSAETTFLASLVGIAQSFAPYKLCKIVRQCQYVLASIPATRANCPNKIHAR